MTEATFPIQIKWNVSSMVSTHNQCIKFPNLTLSCTIGLAKLKQSISKRNHEITKSIKRLNSQKYEIVSKSLNKSLPNFHLLAANSHRNRYCCPRTCVASSGPEISVMHAMHMHTHTLQHCCHERWLFIILHAIELDCFTCLVFTHHENSQSTNVPASISRK